MKALQKIVKLIDPTATIQAAGTGTIYITFVSGKRVRIADHEPNFGAPRNFDYLEVYVKDVEGHKISLTSNIERILDYLNIEANSEVMNIIFSESEKERALADLKLKNQKSVQSVQEDYQQQLSDRLISISKNLSKSEINTILDEAETYAALGANGDKRRKRRVSFVRSELEKRGLPVVSAAELEAIK